MCEVKRLQQHQRRFLSSKTHDATYLYIVKRSQSIILLSCSWSTLKTEAACSSNTSLTYTSIYMVHTLLTIPCKWRKYVPPNLYHLHTTVQGVISQNRRLKYCITHLLSKNRVEGGRTEQPYETVTCVFPFQLLTNFTNFSWNTA